MTRRNAFLAQILGGSFLLVVLVALVIGELWTTARDSAPPVLQQLAKHGAAPEFSLTTRDGGPLATSDLRGTVWIADFIYTRCKDSCPVQSAVMAGLQADFLSYPDLRLVSVTVDPLNDSPEVLSRYAERHGAKRGRWLFLTGEPGEIRRVAQEGFRLSAVPVKSDSTDPVIFHSSRLILIDRKGEIRGYYDSNDPKAVDRLRENTRSLLTKRA